MLVFSDHYIIQMLATEMLKHAWLLLFMLFSRWRFENLPTVSHTAVLTEVTDRQCIQSVTRNLALTLSGLSSCHCGVRVSVFYLCFLKERDRDRERLNEEEKEREERKQERE